MKNWYPYSFLVGLNIRQRLWKQFLRVIHSVTMWLHTTRQAVHCWPETNGLPDISPAKMHLFGIRRELQFRVCDHGEPRASYRTARKKKFYRGEREGNGYSKQKCMAFHWVIARKEEGHSSYWALLLTPEVGPSSGPSTLFKIFKFCLLNLTIPEKWKTHDHI